jgi:FkbM family methyltransferase
MGAFKIDAFEPNFQNIMRFCESIELNGWKNEGEMSIGEGPSVNIWPAGISDKSGTLRFLKNPNPGAGRFVAGDSNVLKSRQGAKELPVLTLDAFAEERGWFDTRPNVAILKIDVERHEANVLMGAKKLLNSRIVQNVFTEVSLEQGTQKSVQKEALEVLVQAGYVTLFSCNVAYCVMSS